MTRWLALSFLGLAIGCSIEQRYVQPDEASSIPPVDAQNDPEPAYGDLDAGAVTSSKKDAGKDAGSSEDAGKQVAPPDAGPTYPHPTAGELFISEVMYDPSQSEPDAEWIELTSTASSTRSLSGLVLVDASNRTHAIGAGVTIAPGAYVVLVRSKAAANVPAAAIAYEYGAGVASNQGIILVNGTTGSIGVHDGATTITQAVYGGMFSTAAGKSVQRKVLDATADSDAAKWCLSSTAWATGSDKGTPGVASDCP